MVISDRFFTSCLPFQHLTVQIFIILFCPWLDSNWIWNRQLGQLSYNHYPFGHNWPNQIKSQQAFSIFVLAPKYQKCWIILLKWIEFMTPPSLKIWTFLSRLCSTLIEGVCDTWNDSSKMGFIQKVHNLFKWRLAALPTYSFGVWRIKTLKNGPTPAFLRLFSVFTNKRYNFIKTWKNVHPVYGAGIRNHNLSNMSRHP